MLLYILLPRHPPPRHAYIHWQTSHSNMLSFMRRTHKHTHTRTDKVAGISSVTAIAVSQKKYVARLIRAATLRVFHRIHSFPAMCIVESYVVLHRVSFVLCLSRRRPSPVLTCALHTVCLMIPCLSEMRRTGNDLCLFVFLGDSVRVNQVLLKPSLQQ